MKRSITPTSHLLVKAQTDHAYDACDFALISLTADWIARVRQRLEWVQPLSRERSFHCLIFWEQPEGFYSDLEGNILPAVLPQGEDWCYVTLEGDELTALTPPTEPLSCHQLVIYGNGSAHFTATAKYSGDEYRSANIDLPSLIAPLSN